MPVKLAQRSHISAAPGDLEHYDVRRSKNRSRFTSFLSDASKHDSIYVVHHVVQCPLRNVLCGRFVDHPAALRHLFKNRERLLEKSPVAPYAPGMSDPLKPVFEMTTAPAAPQNRWTVLFRGFMVIPHTFVLMFLLVGAEVATFFAWFAILFTGRNPFHQFVSNVIRWGARVNAYNYLLTDEYPPFTLSGGDAYPVATQLEVGPMNRVTVFFRAILAVPVGVLSAILGVGMGLVLIVGWIATLIRGTLPDSIHNGVGATLRFQTRVAAYSWLVQDPYPRGLFGEGGRSPGTGVEDSPSGTGADSPTPTTTSETFAPVGPDVLADEVPAAPSDIGLGFPPMRPVEIPIPESTPWDYVVTASGRRTIVTELIVGSIGYVAIVVVYIVIMSTLISSITQGSAWSAGFRGDIVTLRSSGIAALNSIDPSAPNWSAITAACASTNGVVASLKTIPQYPVSGPNKHLLEGFGLIALGASDCTSSIAKKRQAGQLPALERVFTQGAAQLQTFLDQS